MTDSNTSKPSQSGPSPASSSQADLFDDGLPSYDTATAAAYETQPGIGASSSTAPQTVQAPISRQAAYLFSGPPQPENLTSSIPHEAQNILVKTQRQQMTFPDGRILSRDIASETWDPRLHDPTLLYSFMRNMANKAPKLRLRCIGAHSETAARSENVMVNGSLQVRKKGETVRVIDFDFYIDMSDLITPAGKHLLVAPSWKPVHRNSHVISYGPSFAPRRADGYASIGQGEGEGLLEAGRSLTWSARTAHAQWNQRRWGRGFPLWAKRSDVLDAESGTAAPSPDLEGEAALDVKDEPGLKAWCEAFCADRGWLKTFQLRREPWGWNFDGLCKAAKGVIHSTGYQSPDLMVYVEIDEDKMVVRPDNWWSRAINRPFILFLLCVSLIYPLVRLLNRLNIPGFAGRQYDLARATYNLKPFPPLPSTYPGETLASAQDRLPGLFKIHPEVPRNPLLKLGPKGVHYLAGRREGEWYAEWEERIRIACQARMRGQIVGHRLGAGERVSLDGYERNWADQ